MKDNDTQIIFGSEVKSLGGGKVGGYLVRFGDAFKTDLAGDYFTPETDFDVDWTSSVKSSVYFNHGLDKTIGKRKLNNGMKADLKKDEVGIWAEAQLDERDEYEAAILDMVNQGKMGWSSGTASYLVERETVGKSSKITKWGIGLDASLTPTPAEPRNVAIALKSWALESKSLSDFVTNSNDSYIGDTFTASMTMQSLCQASDRLESNIMWQIIYNDNLTDEQKIQAITEAYQELAAFAPKVATALLALDTDELNDQKDMAKSLAFMPEGIEVKAKITLANHAEQIIKAVKSFSKRASSISSVAVESGVKKGAVFNSKNKGQLLTVADKITSAGNEMITHGQSIKDLIAPDEEKSIRIEEIIYVEDALSAFAEFLQLESQTI